MDSNSRLFNAGSILMSYETYLTKYLNEYFSLLQDIYR